MRYLLLTLIALFAACTPAAPPPTATPEQPTLDGNVRISLPGAGSTIYSELMFINGTAEDVDSFTLRLVTASEEILHEMTIEPENNTWLVEFPHEYDDDPIEVTILALPVDTEIEAQYGSMSIVLAGLDHRPGGVFGSITNPVDGSSIGGDTFEVNGMASGLFEGSLVVVLETETETISQQLLTVANPNLIDHVPWSTQLDTNGYTGAATIRAYYDDARDGAEVTVDSVDVTVTTAAG